MRMIEAAPGLLDMWVYHHLHVWDRLLCRVLSQNDVTQNDELWYTQKLIKYRFCVVAVLVV